MKAVLFKVKKAEPRLLDLTAAAAYLGTSRSAIGQLFESGQLSRIRLPGLRARTEIESMLTAHPEGN